MKTIAFLLIILLCSGLAAEEGYGDLLSISFKNGDPVGKDVETGIADAKSLTTEFSGLQTIQVRKPEEFPSVLRSNQRLALFVEDKLLPEHGTNLILEGALISKPDSNEQGSPSVEILFNKKAILKSFFGGDKLSVLSIIPSSCIEEHGNILEIRNTGIQSFYFERLNLKIFNKSKYETCKVREEDTVKHEKLADVAGKCLGDACRRKSMCGFVQLHLIYRFNEGCGSADFTNMLSEKYFFDPVSGEPLDSYFAALRLKQLYEGNPIPLPSNLILKNKDSFISRDTTSWQAVSNSDGIVTVHITALYEDRGQEAELALPVPWTGKTKLVIIKGIIPEKLANSYPGIEKISVETKEIDISNGIYEDNIPLDRAVTLRLVRNGMKDETERTILCRPIVPKRNKGAFIKGIASVSNKRNDTGSDIRNSVRKKGMTSEMFGSSCSLKISDSTKGTVDGTKNIVPFDKWSDFVEISYPEGKSYPSEGVNLLFSNVPNNYREFSFWVYPQSLSPIKRITLQFYIENNKGYYFLAADLKPDEWQRVSLPSDRVKLPSYGKIYIVGDPKLPEYAKGNKVSFEFNGFCTVGDEHPENGKSGLRKFRVAGTGKEKTFVFIGWADSYFEYRQIFKAPAEIESISEISGYKGLKYVYKRDAQILGISGKFPEDGRSISEQYKKLLTSEELNLIEKQKLSLMIISACFEK